MLRRGLSGCGGGRDLLGAWQSLRAASSTRGAATEIRKEIDRCYDNLDKSFCNTKEAYLSKTNWELLRGLCVLRLCAVKPLVHHNQRIIKVAQRLLGKRLFELLMRHSFYGHFVAGADEEDISPTIRKMKEFGVKSILDYSVEADLSKEEAKEATELSAGEDGLAAADRPDSPTNDPFGHIKQYKANVEEFSDRREGALVRTYFYTGEPECDRNMEIFLKSIEGTAKATDGTGFVAVKVTALGRPQLLLQLSEVIAQTQKFYKLVTGCSWEDLVHARLSKAELMERMSEYGVKGDSAVVENFFAHIDFDADGFVDVHEWGDLIDPDKPFQLGDAFRVVNLRTGKLEPLIKPISPEENLQFQNMVNRLHTIAEAADSLGVRMMIDAEQSYFQPAISRLALEMMRKYNRQHPVIFNTYQCYLKSALSSIQLDMHLARRENFHFGAKLVRGAYMEQERLRAETLGYEDPINPTYEATSDMYHRCLTAILDEVVQREANKVSVLAATHNEDSVRFAVEEMKRRRIDPSDKVLCFGQLYGMCDQVSFSLGQAGFSVYKYVPYGPVSDVLPYLSRRALENNAIFEKAMKERELMWSEMKRRWRTGEGGGEKGPFTHATQPATAT